MHFVGDDQFFPIKANDAGAKTRRDRVVWVAGISDGVIQISFLDHKCSLQLVPRKTIRAVLWPMLHGFADIAATRGNFGHTVKLRPIGLNSIQSPGSN